MLYNFNTLSNEAKNLLENRTCWLDIGTGNLWANSALPEGYREKMAGVKRCKPVNVKRINRSVLFPRFESILNWHQRVVGFFYYKTL